MLNFPDILMFRYNIIYEPVSYVGDIRTYNASRLPRCDYYACGPQADDACGSWGEVVWTKINRMKRF